MISRWLQNANRLSNQPWAQRHCVIRSAHELIGRVALPLLGDAGRGDAGVQRLGERIMARLGVMLAAFRAAGAAARTLRPKSITLSFWLRTRRATRSARRWNDRCRIGLGHRGGF
jgi:hypothetical protein